MQVCPSRETPLRTCQARLQARVRCKEGLTTEPNVKVGPPLSISLYSCIQARDEETYDSFEMLWVTAEAYVTLSATSLTTLSGLFLAMRDLEQVVSQDGSERYTKVCEQIKGAISFSMLSVIKICATPEVTECRVAPSETVFSSRIQANMTLIGQMIAQLKENVDGSSSLDVNATLGIGANATVQNNVTQTVGQIPRRPCRPSDQGRDRMPMGPFSGGMSNNSLPFGNTPPPSAGGPPGGMSNDPTNGQYGQAMPDPSQLTATDPLNSTMGSNVTGNFPQPQYKRSLKEDPPTSALPMSKRSDLVARGTSGGGDTHIAKRVPYVDYGNATTINPTTQLANPSQLQQNGLSQVQQTSPSNLTSGGPSNPSMMSPYGQQNTPSPTPPGSAFAEEDCDPGDGDMISPNGNYPSGGPMPERKKALQKIEVNFLCTSHTP